MELNTAELDAAIGELNAIIIQLDTLADSIPPGDITATQAEPLKPALVTMTNAVTSTRDRLVSMGIEPEPPVGMTASVEEEEEEV